MRDRRRSPSASRTPVARCASRFVTRARAFTQTERRPAAESQTCAIASPPSAARSSLTPHRGTERECRAACRTPGWTRRRNHPLPAAATPPAAAGSPMRPDAQTPTRAPEPAPLHGGGSMNPSSRVGQRAGARRAARPRAAALSPCDLLFSFLVSVTSDALEMVPTGGELTLFEAVGRAGPDFL